MPERKLLEVWEVSGQHARRLGAADGSTSYLLRVEVGAFQHQLGARTTQQAEEVAEFEAIEVLRKLIADYDAGQVGHAHDVPRRPGGRR